MNLHAKNPLGFAIAVLLSMQCGTADEKMSVEPISSLRVATFNVSFNRNSAGRLAEDLIKGSTQAGDIAAILRTVRPDIVLLNEFDFDPQNRGVQAFCSRYLESTSTHGTQPIRYEFRYTSQVNTGVPSGHDLNRNGNSEDPADAFGFGRFPGQYGMVILSRFPIEKDSIRTFQTLRWNDMPGAVLPREPGSPDPWYPAAAMSQLRLSSKSHWDVPVRIQGRTLHLLACHPTPPAFDGPEDRNGRRNHDEIRLWADYLSPESASWIVDDTGRSGGLPVGKSFVVLGDLNSDPHDGGSFRNAVLQLIRHDRISATPTPQSKGAVAASAAQMGANLQHKGDPASDTADFSDRQVGNLRVDYVLPSKNLTVTKSGVFWPSPGEPFEKETQATDHRLVWIDLAW